MSQKFRNFRVSDGYQTEDIESLVFFGVVAMQPHYSSENWQKIFFSECMSSFENNLGELFVLEENNKQIAFCFVFDKYSADGVYHIHLISVHGKYRQYGLGKKLLNHVISKLGSDGITLETQPETVPFFTKNGFNVISEVLMHGYVGMALRADLNIGNFTRPAISDELLEVYNQRFKRVVKRLGIT